MDSARDAEYRLRLARGFLTEAEEDLRLSRWRACVDNSQLAVEDAAKSVIARFSTIPRSHAVAALLTEHLEQGRIPQEFRGNAETLRDLRQELGFEEARGITPLELFREPEARRAIELARRAVNLAEEITQ